MDTVDPTPAPQQESSKPPASSAREYRFAASYHAILALPNPWTDESSWFIILFKTLVDLAVVFVTPVILLTTGLIDPTPIGIMAAAAVGPTLLWLHTVGSEWWIAIRHDGWARLRTIPSMLRLMSRTRTSWPHYHMKWPRLWLMGTLLSVCFLIALHYAVPPSEAWHTALACACIVVTTVCLYLKYAVPPTVLILTSSTPQQVEWALDICTPLSPMRVLAMLDEQRLEGAWDQSVAQFKMILRTRDDADWPETVHGFMGLATIIVMDTSEPVRDAVKHEAEYLCASALVNKTVFLSDVNGNYPLLETCALPSETEAIFVPRYLFLGFLKHLILSRAQLPDCSPYLFAPRTLAEALRADSRFLHLVNKASSS